MSGPPPHRPSPGEEGPDVEEGHRLALDWAKLDRVAETGAGVVPVVLQDADSRQVLFIGYGNERSHAESFRLGAAVLWSTSRNELWHKGATSGDTLTLVEVRVNCEQNSLLYLVRPDGRGVCHTHQGGDPKAPTRGHCYYRVVRADGSLVEP